MNTRSLSVAAPVGGGPPDARLAVLQAYPLGTLHVETPYGRGRLTGLRYDTTHGCIVADVQDIALITGGAVCVPEAVKPCLYGFDALATELPDGTVPAVEVAKLQGMYAPSSASLALGEYEVRVVHHNRAGLRGEFAISKRSFDKGNLFQPVIDYLRSKHFAVGLDASQFIAKESGVRNG